MIRYVRFSVTVDCESLLDELALFPGHLCGRVLAGWLTGRESIGPGGGLFLWEPDRRQKMVLAGLARVARVFSSDRYADQMENIFLRLGARG